MVKIYVVGKMESTSMPWHFPHSYEPTWAKSPDTIEEFKNILLKEAKKLETYHTVNIYNTKFQDSEYYFAIYEKYEQLAYVVKLDEFTFTGDSESLKLISKKTLCQASVWRDKTIILQKAQILPKYIFWKYLFTRHRAIVTDGEQSDNGRGFWSYRLSEALAKRYRMFGLKCIDNEGTLEVERAEELFDVGDIARYYTVGRDTSGKYRRILILGRK